ncbi:hypothetical protein Btru_046142 [Bulinus truncatus]|nr:hypothetical protein Btru_046142 [Bulinus truncatus]
MIDAVVRRQALIRSHSFHIELWTGQTRMMDRESCLLAPSTRSMRRIHRTLCISIAKHTRSMRRIHRALCMSIAEHTRSMRRIHRALCLFAIGYLILLVLICTPLCYVQLKVGAIYKKGIVGIFSHILPLYKGVAVTLLIMTYFRSITHALEISYGIYYMFASCIKPFPWTLHEEVIVKPMQSLAKRPRIWLKIAIAWTISLILPIPQLFIFLQYNDGVKYDGTPKRICGSKGYTAQWQRKAYFTFTTVYILVIPIIIMMYCYVKIIRVVWVRAKNESSRRRPSCLIPPRPPATTPTPDAPPKQISESYEKSGVRCGCDGSDLGSVASSPVVSWAKSVKEKKDSNDNASAGVKKKVMDFSVDSHPGSPRMSVRRSLVTASKRRALIMTLSVVISFLVCHLPYFIVNLIRIYSDYKVKLDSLKVFSEFMVMVHSTLNPILYGLFTLRQYHLKYLFSLVTGSHGPAVTATAHGARQRQSSSDERHQLLNTVRSKLTLRSSPEDVRVKSLTRSVKKGQKKNFRREQHPNQAASTTAAVMIVSSPSSTLPQPSSSISILNKFRFKQLPVYSKKKRVQFNGKQHNDTLLFANSDAINLKNKRRKKSFGPEHSVMEISTSPATRQDFAVGGSLITNTHILKSNGSSPSSSLVGASNVNFRKHGGVSDMTQNSRFTNVDDAEVTRRNKAVPWAPQDDEYIIGGLTRV